MKAIFPALYRKFPFCFQNFVALFGVFIMQYTVSSLASPRKRPHPFATAVKVNKLLFEFRRIGTSWSELLIPFHDSVGIFEKLNINATFIATINSYAILSVTMTMLVIFSLIKHTIFFSIGITILKFTQINNKV